MQIGNATIEFPPTFGWTSNPTTLMSGNGSHTEFHGDPLGESPSYKSLLAHTLFSRQTLSGTSFCFARLVFIVLCLSACVSSAGTVSISETDVTLGSGLFGSPPATTSTASTTSTTQTPTTQDIATSTFGTTSSSQGVPSTGISSGLSASLITADASSPAATSITSISGTPASSSGGSGTSTSAIASTNRKSTVIIGPIIGGVVGVLMLVVFVVGLIWYCKSRRKRVQSPSEFTFTSAEPSAVLPSSIVEPFRIPSEAPQNSRQLQSSNKPILSGGMPASPPMRKVEATRNLIPTTTQTPPSMQMPSESSAGTPIGGLYNHAMVGSGSRVVLHEDSGIRLPRQGEDGMVVEMPPLYTPS